MQSAIKPDLFFKNMPSLQVEDEKAKQAGASEEERLIYAMSQQKGWHLFREFLLNLINELNEVNDRVIASGVGFEVIGQNAVIVSTTRAVVNRALQKVSDAAEACQLDETKKDK